LTHTLEVAQIARTVSRGLGLNEDLTEAIALGHDLGHTPFGHAGEEVLNQIVPGGFSHNAQSLRVVDVLESNGRGLNLTFEVREGILKHSKGRGEILPSSPKGLPGTLEGQVVRLSDIIAYICHDLDDALRAGIIKDENVPQECLKILGPTNARRIDTMVRDLVHNTLAGGGAKLALSREILWAMNTLRDFLYSKVYEVHGVLSDFERTHKLIADIYAKFLSDETLYQAELGQNCKEETRERRICDFIAGMTDRYALNLYERIFFPKPWAIL
jgi:dGTPase